MKIRTLALLSGWLLSNGALATNFDTLLSGGITFTITGADGPPVPGESGVYLGGDTDCMVLLGEHPYAVQTIAPGTSGPHNLETLAPSGGVDTMLAVYSPDFDPAHPAANLIACNDDYDDATWPLSRVIATLVGGAPYTVVLTTWDTVPLMSVEEESAIAEALVNWRVTPDLTAQASAVAAVPVLAPGGLAILIAVLALAGARFHKRGEA